MVETKDFQIAQFDRTTATWGPITMVIGLVLSLAGPAYLVFFTELEVPLADIVTAFTAVALTFGVVWVTEPLTYYPMLGPASMYQAFMIGNISNKLLPAAITAQDTVGAETGTKKAEITSVMAICGAAVVHLVSLFIFVGILGNWLISLMPQEILTLVSVYTLPTIMGAVSVQALLTSKDVRSSLIALVTAAACCLLLVPYLAGISGIFNLLATPLAVVIACVAVWLLKKKSVTEGN